MTSSAPQVVDGVDAARRGWPIRPVLRAVVPFVIALVIGGFVLLATGHNPFDFAQLLIREAFGGTDRIAATLSSATPLLFTGLATAIAFRAGVFNVGVEGGFIMGGFVTATVAAHLPGPLAIPLAMFAGAASGIAVSALPGWLQARWKVDEVVTTLMFNFVVTGLTGWLVTSFLQARGVANSATPLIPKEAWLPDLLTPYALTSGDTVDHPAALTASRECPLARPCSPPCQLFRRIGRPAQNGESPRGRCPGTVARVDWPPVQPGQRGPDRRGTGGFPVDVPAASAAACERARRTPRDLPSLEGASVSSAQHSDFVAQHQEFNVLGR